MDADIFELNKRLYVRWLEHEDDVLGLESPEAFVRYGMADLTTDWNAMGELIAVVAAKGWEVQTCSYVTGKAYASVCRYAPRPRREFIGFEDTLPLAVCRAVDQIPMEARQ